MFSSRNASKAGRLRGIFIGIAGNVENIEEKNK
jgi:hypothetical protein